MLSSAVRLRAVGVVLSALVGYLCHPSSIFALPTALAVFAVRSRTVAERPWKSRWGASIRIGAIVATGAVLAAITAGRTSAQGVIDHYGIGLHGSHDPARFLALLGRFFLSIGNRTMPAREALFWVVATTVGAFGLWSLIRAKRWERVALVVGTLASAVALFVIGGSEILQPGMVRYGNALMTPAVLAFACLLRAVLVEPSNGWSRSIRVGQNVAMGAAALTLILSFDLGALDHSKCQDGGLDAARATESIWTFGLDAIDPRVEAIETILAAHRGEGPAVIVCESWMTAWPVAYLGLGRDDVRVINHEARPDLGLAALRDGAFALSRPGSELDRTVRMAVPSLAIGGRGIIVNDRRVATLYQAGRAAPRDLSSATSTATAATISPGTTPRPAAGTSRSREAAGNDSGASRVPSPRRGTTTATAAMNSSTISPRPGFGSRRPASGPCGAISPPCPKCNPPPAITTATAGSRPRSTTRSEATGSSSTPPDRPRSSRAAGPAACRSPATSTATAATSPASSIPRTPSSSSVGARRSSPSAKGRIMAAGRSPRPSISTATAGPTPRSTRPNRANGWPSRSLQGAGSFPGTPVDGQPIPGDFDGDGRAELLVFDPQAGTVRGPRTVTGAAEPAMPRVPPFTDRVRTIAAKTGPGDPAAGLR